MQGLPAGLRLKSIGQRRMVLRQREIFITENRPAKASGPG